jgi:hypothetical protein
MTIENTVRIANSMPSLEQLLAGIEAGRRPQPDWIHIQGDCRLEKLPGEALEALVRRLHASVLRGFRAKPQRSRRRSQRLDFWRRVARNGFHDFASEGWNKCYGSQFIEDYDYVRAYLEGGIDALDPYEIYSAVLGTHDYSIEDFIHTPFCEKVETVVEPMAGTGDFSYLGHFRHPELRYILFDVDTEARDHVLTRPWLEGSDHHYLVADVLDPSVWQTIESKSRGRSLSYIGKQSHHFFGAQQLYRLLELGTRAVDYFILETPEPGLVSDLDEVDLLTRPEMEDAGFEVALVEQEDHAPNLFTNEFGFRLEIWDDSQRRTLFRYANWTSWQPPMLVTLARLLGLDVFYLNEEAGDFVTVDEGDHGDAHDNVNFMLFRRRP